MGSVIDPFSGDQVDADFVSQARNYIEIAALAIAFVIGLWRIRVTIDNKDRELEKRLYEGESERKQIISEIEGLKGDLKKEFGGNSGGMREAINRMGSTLERVDDKTNTLAVEMGELRGRFEQHMKSE